MTKTHLIKDESLGGVLREYVEVDRKAEVGDKVVVTVPHEGFPSGSIMKVVYVFENGHVNAWHEKTVTTNFIANGEFAVLEPTDIIHVDGKRYRMVDRKANVGDEIIVTDSPIVKSGTIGTCIANSSGYDGLITIDVHSYEDMYALINADTDKYHILEPGEPSTNSVDIIEIDGEYYRLVDRKANVGDKVFGDGIVREVICRFDGINAIEFEHYVNEEGDGVDGWFDGCYKVLEPITPLEELHDYVDSQPTDQLDIIARLTRKVAQLERENADIKRDLETWAQEVERLKRKLDDDRRDIEMVIDDIVTLDERTQPEELAKKLAEAITKGLNAIESRHYG